MKEKLLTLTLLLILPVTVSRASAKTSGITDIPDSIPIHIDHHQNGMVYSETKMIPYIDDGIPEQNPQVNSQGPRKANTGKTWTIGSGGNFADINAAMSDSRVVAGDVLELKPGTILTGNQTINKVIHLIGNGYEMDSDGNLASNVAQIQGHLHIRAEGVRISNLALSQWPYEGQSGSYNNPSIRIYSSQSIIEGCYIKGWIYGYANNATIRQCFLRNISGNNNSGWQIQNNIIYEYTSNGFNILCNLTNATIDHNIVYSEFKSSDTSGYSITSVSSSTFTNNIIVHFPYDKSYAGTYNGTIEPACLSNNKVNHNVFSGASPNTSNRGGVNAIGDIFDYTKYVSYQWKVVDYDACFHLVAGSPAAGYATDGGDCGPWSGAYPYVVGGTVGSGDDNPDTTFKDGDIFTAQTAEGVEMTFKVISASEKTCQAGTGGWQETCIDKNTSGAITIPTTIKGLTVTAIASSAFFPCSGLTSVTIPNGVTSIGSYPFSGCSNLTSFVIETGNTKYDSRNNCNAIIETATNTLIAGCKNTIIPNSVTSIGEYAFYQCSGLTSVTIPNSVTSISWRAFLGCKDLTSVTIGNGVASIGTQSFCQCYSLTYVTIGNGMTSIGDSAFDECTSLTSITIPGSVTSIGRNAFSRTGWYNAQPDGILYLDNWLIGYKGTEPTGNVIIKNGTRGVADHAFYKCSGLTSVTIPNGVTSIGSYAFDYCSGLTSVTIPNSVTSIGSWAFGYCSGMTSVTSEIQEPFATRSGAFEDIPSDATLYVPAGTKAQYQALADWNRFTNIEESAPDFKDYDIFTAQTAEGVEMTFQVLSAQNKTCQVGANKSTCISKDYSGSVTIPETVKGLTVVTIGPYAFNQCKISAIKIPNTVTTIDWYVFMNCTNLESITIPTSVTSIGNDVFNNSFVPFFKVEEGNSVYDSRNNCNAIIETATNKLLYGGMSTMVPEDVAAIGQSAFYGRIGMQSINIPNSVTVIENSAFSNSSLTEITLPDNLTTLGGSAFFGCSNLSRLTIPANVTSIGQNVVTHSGIQSLVINSENKVYDSRNNCNAIIETATNTLISGCDATIIPASVKTIGEYAFYMAGFSSIIIPDGVNNIGPRAFLNCSNLKSVTISNSVTNIGYASFAGCSELPSITIPNSVTSIDSYVFNSCNSLMSVTSNIQNPFKTANSAFSGVPSDATLYVPAGTVAQYRALADWNRFTNITEIQDAGGYTKAELQAMLDAIGQRLDAIGSMINEAEAMYKNLSGNYNISDDVRAVVEKEWSRMSSYIDKYNEALKGYDVLKQQVQAMTGNDNGTLYNMIVALQTKIDQAENEVRVVIAEMLKTIEYYAAEDMENRLNEMARNINIILTNILPPQVELNNIREQLGDYYFMRKGTDEFLTKIEIAKARLEEAVAAANVANEYYKYLLDHHSITTIEDIVNFYTGYADLQNRINNINNAIYASYSEIEVLKYEFGNLEVNFPNENLAFAIRPTGLSNGPQIGYKQSLGFVLSSNGMMWFEQKSGADFYFRDADGHYIVATSDGTTQAGTKAEATVWTGLCDGKGNYTFTAFVNSRYLYLGCNGTNENSALTVSNTNYSWTITEFKQDQDHDYDWSIGSGGDFADVNAAMSDDRVKDGHVLQVLNGTILNGTTYITKAVTIKGNGYEDKSDGHIYGIYIDCEGVTLKNLHNGYIYVRANNATIERCRTSSISGRENYESDDVTIRGCLVLGYVCSYYNNISYGWKISNNIIIATNYWGNALDYLEEATVDHNLIINYESDVYGLYAVGAVNNSSFTNNIFLRPAYSQGISDNAINSATKFEYNIISNSGSYAKWPTNITGYNNMAKLFECSGERTTDTYYKLVAGSPALGYANDGGDCGPWSGAFPYLINGKENTSPEPNPTQWKLDPTLTTDTERYEFATLDALFNFMLSPWSWYKEGMTDVTVSVADATYTMDLIPNINTSNFDSVESMIEEIYTRIEPLRDRILAAEDSYGAENITFSMEAQHEAIFQFNLQYSQAYNALLEFMAAKIVEMQAQGMTQEEIEARKAQWLAFITERMNRFYEAMLKFASHIKTTNIIILIDNDIIIDPFVEIEPNDLLALKNIYNMLGGSSWTNKKWKINDYGAKKEDFPGVTFDDEGYVVEINLENNNLRGTINPTGWTWQLCLPRLTGLYLQKNNISGDLSPWLKGVNRNNRLKALNMSYNNLTEISDTIPSSITSLNLENQNREWYRPDGVYTDPLKIEAMSDMTPIRLYLSANQTVVMPSLFTYNHKSLTHSARPTIYIINAEGIDKYGYFKSSGEDTYSLAWKDNEYTEKQNAPCYVRFDNPYGSVYPAYLRYIEGDANMSGYTDVLDVQTTLNYVLNGGGVWQFNRSAANTYEDNLINVQDIVCMVNIVLNNEAVAEGIILNTSSSRRHLRRAADAMDAQGWLYTEKGRVMLTTVNEVGAIDLELKGVSTSQVSLLLNHSQYQMIGRNTEEGSRYVIFSPTGQPIPASEEVALLAVSSQTELIGAQAADMEAQELELAIGQPTGLEAIDNGQLTNDNAPIYNVAGQRLSKMQRGINITNGRKVLK